MSRKYDIIIHGATGFTGSLVVKYLISVMKTNESLKVAVSGRNESKLIKVIEESSAGDLKIDILLADNSNQLQLNDLVKSTKVIISLVGPYIIHGETLVRACAENGTHYVDLTGEAAFVAKMIQKYSSAAVDSRAIMIHSCGFDSVPSDLCSFLAVQRLKPHDVGEVKSLFKVKGGASGGTIASGLAMMNGSKDDMKVASNPFALSPIPGNHKPKPVIVESSTFRGEKSYGGFFIMAPHNEAIVRRSWGILQSSSNAATHLLAYGDKFQYSELMATAGPISAALTSIVVYLVGAALILVKPLRTLLAKYGPQPGEGPSLEAQKNGWFKTTTTATSVDKLHQVQVTMKGTGDPGYSGTAKLISECALAILLDNDRLPPLSTGGGFLTPATALGNVLVERLEATGSFTFNVEVDDSKKE